MLIERLIIIGAGGHAKVVVDTVQRAALKPEQILAADDDVNRENRLFMGLNIVTPISKAISAGDFFHVAIGNNQVRERLHKLCLSADCQPYSIIHPQSSQAYAVELAAGVFVAAQAVVGPDASIDAGTIINHGAVVDHDCKIGCFAHIAPNATLGGGVSIGERTLVGAGATLLPGIKVAADVVIGAGAVVVNDIPEGETVVGMPARKQGEFS